MSLAAPLNDRDPARPAGAGAARLGSSRRSGDDAFGSLITLGPRKFKKKPVLVLDADELAAAHRQFEVDGAHIMGEGDGAALTEHAAPEPYTRPAMVLGLAPIGSDEPVMEEDLGEDAVDESDLPPLPESFADTDELLGLGEADADEDREAEAAFAPAPAKRVGIDMVALRLAARSSDQSEDETPGLDEAEAAEAYFEDPPHNEPEAEATEQAADTAKPERKSTIEAAAENWDMPFLGGAQANQPAEFESLEFVPDLEAEPEPEILPELELEVPLEPQPEPEPEPEPQDEMLLDDQFDDWSDEDEHDYIQPAFVARGEIHHSQLRARLVHDAYDTDFAEQAGGLRGFFSRIWRWIAARFGQ